MRRMVGSRRWLELVVPLVWVIVGLAACHTPPAGPIELTILHTNDIHGYALPEPATWVKKTPPPLIGGMAALELAVIAERKKAAHSLLFDGGDVSTGQPASRFIYRGVKGGYLIEAMNRLGYDAACIGNHEFDAGLDNLRAMLELSSFPWLSANLHDKRENPLAIGTYRIFERGGLRIGVIGLTTTELSRLIDPRMLEGFEVDQPAETLQPLIDQVRQKADLVILLTHIGLPGDQQLARSLKGVDLIIGGHTHTRLKKPIVTNGVIICQAGSYLRNLGVLKLTIENGKITAHSGRLRALWHDDKLHGSPEMGQLLREVRQRVKALMSDRLGQLKTGWKKGRSRETNAGTFIAECIRRRLSADIGMINSGGIRSDLPVGPISRGQLLTVLPFSNKLVLVELTGAQLRAVCAHNALSQLTRRHGILQLSGIRYRWRRVGDQKVALVEVQVGGKPLDDKQIYKIATNDYVAFSQPMKYLGLTPGRRTVRGGVVAGAVAAEIQRLGVVEARLENRMTEVK